MRFVETNGWEKIVSDFPMTIRDCENAFANGSKSVEGNAQGLIYES